MSQDLAGYLRQALARLTRVAKTAKEGGARENEHEMVRLRLLEELIKEQMPNEDTGSSARAPR